MEEHRIISRMGSGDNDFWMQWSRVDGAGGVLLITGLWLALGRGSPTTPKDLDDIDTKLLNCVLSRNMVLGSGNYAQVRIGRFARRLYQIIRTLLNTPAISPHFQNTLRKRYQAVWNKED